MFTRLYDNFLGFDDVESAQKVLVNDIWDVSGASCETAAAWNLRAAEERT